MQSDGNLVIYDSSRKVAIWATGTTGHPGAFLAVQEDGNIVIYSGSRAPVWATGTTCETNAAEMPEMGSSDRRGATMSPLKLIK